MKNNMETLLQVNSSAIEKMWDLWMASIGSFSWSQNQMEKLAKDYIDRRKVNREESVKIIEGLMEQTRKNQKELQGIFEEAVKSTFGNVKMPDFFRFNELSKKVDDLTEKTQNIK